MPRWGSGDFQVSWSRALSRREPGVVCSRVTITAAAAAAAEEVRPPDTPLGFSISLGAGHVRCQRKEGERLSLTDPVFSSVTKGAASSS